LRKGKGVCNPSPPQDESSLGLRNSGLKVDNKSSMNTSVDRQNGSVIIADRDDTTLTEERVERTRIEDREANVRADNRMTPLMEAMVKASKITKDEYKGPAPVDEVIIYCLLMAGNSPILRSYRWLEEEEDRECQVCYDRVEDRTYTNGCLHSFCYECIKEWSLNTNTCPLCRTSFTRLRHNFQQNGECNEVVVEQLVRYPEPPQHILLATILGQIELTSLALGQPLYPNHRRDSRVLDSFHAMTGTQMNGRHREEREQRLT